MVIVLFWRINYIHKELKKIIRKSISLAEKISLENLTGYSVIRTESTKVFDELAAYTANLFNTQIAVINFVDQQNRWIRKDHADLNKSFFKTETSICSLAVGEGCAHIFDEISLAPMLMTNVLIAAELGMYFYASAPIVNDEGIRIGSVCIVDAKRREFLPLERAKLEWVAETVKKEINNKKVHTILA